MKFIFKVNSFILEFKSESKTSKPIMDNRVSNKKCNQPNCKEIGNKLIWAHTYLCAKHYNDREELQEEKRHRKKKDLIGKICFDCNSQGVKTPAETASWVTKGRACIYTYYCKKCWIKKYSKVPKNLFPEV